MMDLTKQIKNFVIALLLVLIFSFVFLCENQPENTMSGMFEGAFVDTLDEHHTVSPWYHTSVDPEGKQGEASSLSHDRWRTQMAFSRPVYSFQVKEDTVPGTAVGKVETLFESLRPLTYSVQEDDGDNLFLLSPTSGEFLLSRSLDFESQRFYILTVELQQGDSVVSSVRVYFNVLDVNDNPPVFSQDRFVGSLREDTPIGTCFLLIDVSDIDDGDNGKLELKVLSGDEDDLFTIDSSGHLCLNKELDRERQSSHTLAVMAKDCAQPLSFQLSSTVYVFVAVEDVNDNAPQFRSAKNIYVPEDAALQSVLMTAYAEDEDVGLNGEVWYSLSNTSGGVFSINSTSGQVYLEQMLDREEMDMLIIGITATDKGSPQMTGTMDITVHVEDINDNDPVLSRSSYNLTVREDISRATSLFHVQASDQDKGLNGQVRFTLSPSGPFVVDMVRGVITIMAELDREKNSSYDFVVIAEDQGAVPRSATASVRITVLDINDSHPRFTPDTLVIHIQENEEEPSQLLHQVSAVDEDEGPNGQITYFLEKGNSDDLFSISPDGVFQILRNLDRETQSVHVVTIIAIDSGLPAMTGTLVIHVIVEDVNDNAPEFTEETYNTIVSEDSPVGTVFAMITASDADDGVNGQLRYFMEDLDLPFAIGETNGELITTKLLDRETVATYTMTLFAIDDNLTHPLSSYVLVTVLVADVNDHWPQFIHNHYVTYVPSELDEGTVVCAVRATDADIDFNAELHYSLSGENSNLFYIANTGTVFTLIKLQNMDDIVIDVHVEDAGENPKSDSTTISIRFRNSSDFPEIRMNASRPFLPEDEPVGASVAVISAASFRAELISFYISSGNFEDTFRMDPLSGILTLEKPLDYENKKDFSLLIEARDSGLPPFSSFLEVQLNISDRNDNFPLFTQKEYRCEVLENSLPSAVCEVFAIDADSLNFSSMSYSIIGGNSENFFLLHSETGLLSTTVSLDRETISEFLLTVEVVESDEPLHKDKSTIIVSILDSNDNSPHFTEIFRAEVSEDVRVGHTILQVTSIDPDSSGQIKYGIQEESEPLPFSIDIHTGYITVNRILDRESQEYYVFKVNANDSAWSVSTEVTIVVTDVNDNVPIFGDQFYTAFLTEGQEQEEFVLQIDATDADAGPNGNIFYVIDPPSEDFWINATSGEIFTQQTLNLHNFTFEIFQFTVFAYDCGSPSLSSNATVEVRLDHFNQHPPVFLPIPPLIALPSHLPEGTEVLKLIALDPDVNSGGDIEYYLSGGNASRYFWIELDTGSTILYQTLADRKNQALSLLVLAKDRGYPPLTTETEINFYITEENWFSPTFKNPEITFLVPEDIPVGSVIGRVQAEDRDEGPNGVITYHIVNENHPPPMSVGDISGLITLVSELDFEKNHTYNFQVKATDSGWISKTGPLNVTVLITDINDNPPIFSSTEYQAEVTENSEIGKVVLYVEATDIDSGTNAQISYSLFGEHVDKFAIDKENGGITTTDVFDFEKEQTFDLTVKASNNGRHALFSLAHVVIQVLDANEFIPRFGREGYNFSLLRNAPVGTLVGNVTAVDYDQGSQGEVFYLMFGQTENKLFDVDYFSGVIRTSRSLRIQVGPKVVFKVLAKNSGVINGLDVDETLVHINVVDVNDAPIFSSLSYYANVTEDSLPGTYVLTVSAIDLDSPSDWNHFFFSIEGGNVNASFSIDPLSGEMYVNSPLDRELWSVYNLSVIAIDNGLPSATGTTSVIVTIVDVNDNSPIFISTESQVLENQPEGTVVTRLDAIDLDIPPNQRPFIYWLVSESPSSAFLLTTDGVLLTKQILDREHVSEYRILVGVKDAGFPFSLSSTTTFFVKVLDENDNPPLPRNIFIEVKYFGSSFQGGMIGNVHPEDRDESDKFNCSIKSGPVNMFTIPNGTCELWSLPFQGEATYNVTIETSDELHFPVNNSVYVKYKGFTNASIDSCILFYVSASSMDEFLSKKYLRFVKALDSLFNLQASKTHVFGIKHIGNEILLLAAVKSYNGQYLSKEVASGISAGHRNSLEAQSNVTIVHITTDPCFNHPCQNRAVCSKNIHISQEVAVLESMAVIFVSPQTEVFNCTCAVGFAGSLCEEDIDECDINPCENNGTCENTAGSFHCHCLSGFSGSFCSADEDECLKVKCQNGGTCVASQNGSYCHCEAGYEGQTCEDPVDHCSSTPCLQGTCINLQTGFFCKCPFGVSGVYCEEHSYGFEELSFMEFPPLDRRTNLVYLEFATVQRNSLLLYNPGGSSSRDFFALEIVDGTIQLSYDLGSGPLKLKTHKQVADGSFHSVTARRIGNMGSLLVDNCTDVMNNGFCFSISDGPVYERTLDVGNVNMSFGGLRMLDVVLHHPNQISSHDFVGCIRNIYVNGILLSPTTALATFNVFDRCTRASVSLCDNAPCKNGGVCHDLWSEYLCECQSPFSGRNCATEMSEQLVIRLSEGHYIEYTIKESFKRDYQFREFVDRKERNSTNSTVFNIKFKTEKDRGVLFFVLGQKAWAMLMIKEKKPVYVFKDMLFGKTLEFVVDTLVADGMWHALTLSSNGQVTTMTVDGKSIFIGSEGSMDCTPDNVEKIILSGAPREETQLEQSGFSGCVEYFNATGYTLPIGGHSGSVEVRPSSAFAQPSCSSSAVCLPSPCSADDSSWMCRANSLNESCICLHDVSKHSCDLCTSAARDHCPLEQQSSKSLWIIVLLLPLIIILVIIFKCVAIHKMRHRREKYQNEAFWHKTHLAKASKVFCFSEKTEKGNCQNSGKANPSSLSELEYYETGSIYNAFCFDRSSLRFSWNSHLSTGDSINADCDKWQSLRMLITRFKKCKNSKKPESVSGAAEKPVSCKTAKQQVVKRFPQPESLEPTQCLSFDEICMLNAPSDTLKFKSNAMNSARKKDTSSESESVTSSEYESGHLKHTLSKQRIHELPGTSGHAMRKNVNLSTNSPLQQRYLPESDQEKTKNNLSKVVEEWVNILNIHLPFNSYAPVFEDIANLPSETGDIEEII